MICAIVVMAKNITKASAAPVFGQKFHGVFGEARITESLLVCLWFSLQWNGECTCTAWRHGSFLEVGLLEILLRT
jgi:hypothetical protein